MKSIKLKTILTQKFKKDRQWVKKISQYIAAFDHIDKTLIVSSATSGGVSITPFASVIGAPAGISSASFTLVFSLNTGIIKKILQITRNKKKKHNKILILAKSKLNSIKTLISKGLIDLEINHEEFIPIVKKRKSMKKKII